MDTILVIYKIAENITTKTKERGNGVKSPKQNLMEVEEMGTHYRRGVTWDVNEASSVNCNVPGVSGYYACGAVTQHALQGSICCWAARQAPKCTYEPS